MAKKNDPDGPLPKWGEPEGVKQYMKKTPKQTKTIKVGEDTVGSNKCHYALVMDRKVTATGTKEEMLAKCAEEGGRVWVSTKNVGDIVEGAEYHVTRPGGSLKKPDSVHKSKSDAMKAAYRLSGKKHMGTRGGQVYRVHNGEVTHGFDTEGRKRHLNLDHDKVTGKKSIREAKYSVDVDGLPRFYMEADSPAQVKIALRKLLKKASSIDSVERVHDAKIKQDLRQRLKGGETDKRNVDEEVMDEEKKYSMKQAIDWFGSDKKNIAWTMSSKKRGQPLFGHWLDMTSGEVVVAKEKNPPKGVKVYKKGKLAEKLDPSKHDAGDYVKDFKDSNAPQFKGKSMEKRRKMAIAAYLSARRQKGLEEEVELQENRMKAAKELQAYAKKRGGIDKDDFLMAGQLVKDNKMRDLKKFLRAMDTDPRDGVIQILHRNGLKEEVMNEDMGTGKGKYKAGAEKSKFGGYRAHLKNPQGKTSYLSAQAYKTHKHAAGEAAAYHKGYFGGPVRASERGAERAVAAYRAKNKEHMHEEVEQVNEYITSKQIKMAKGIANDPRHKGGDMTGASKKMEKIKKGLSNHPAVKKALRTANEEVEQLEELTDKMRPHIENMLRVAKKQLGKDAKFEHFNKMPNTSELRVVFSFKDGKERAFIYSPSKKSLRIASKAKARAMNKEEVEQVDELKKSTLASYIKKASRSRSASTSLAKDFDDQSYRPLAKMNRHSPNITGYYNKKGQEKKKSPKKFDKAKKDYDTLKSLSKTFSDQAKRRQQGIDRAATKLAREGVEQVSEEDYGLKNDYGLKIRRYEMIKKAAKKIQRRAQSASKSDYKKSDKKGMADVKTEGYKVPSNYAAMMLKKKKAEAKKKLSPAQSKHMDTDKDGDIDGADLKNLRNKKKS